MIIGLLFQLHVAISAENVDPVLLVNLPGESRTAAEVIFPEHVTVRPRGSNDVEHLYLFRRGDARVQVRHNGNNFEYQRELPRNIHMLARATLENDGLLFHYEFENRSDVAYDMLTAVTDPRLKWILHDVRLERTFVHTPKGFDLLASDFPQRSTMPLDRWLPACVLASCTWPVAPQRTEVRDQITYYNRSTRVDEPLLATVSTNGRWVAASFTRNAGNVWSNPELTCQHVDPQIALPAHGKVTIEVKLLLFRGTLADAQSKFLQQRPRLQ